MSTINEVFKRYETKFILTKEQYEKIAYLLSNHIKVDEYGLTTIQSIYYDTPNNFLIRRSLEKPEFKEKLRLRSYGLSTDNKKVFLEIKRKYEDVVYKRRITLKEKEANEFLYGNSIYPDKQIAKEIAYFKKYYKDLKEAMVILYDRVAYVDNNSDLRITFDHNIKYRVDDLNLHTSLDGNLILNEGDVLMEIKTANAFPLWLARLLSENKIYKTSFSKYGKAYMIEEAKKLNGKRGKLTWKNFSDQLSVQMA